MRLVPVLLAVMAAAQAEDTAKIQARFFVCTDCPVSNFFAPEVQSICRDYRPRVSCTLVYEDLKPNPAAIRRHMAEYGYSGMPAVIDADRAIANRWNATVTPQVVLTDSRGAVRYRGRINDFFAALGRPRRQVTEHNLRDAIDAVLQGRAVPQPETKALGCYIVSPNVLEDK